VQTRCPSDSQRTRRTRQTGIEKRSRADGDWNFAAISRECGCPSVLAGGPRAKCTQPLEPVAQLIGLRRRARFGVRSRSNSGASWRTGSPPTVVLILFRKDRCQNNNACPQRNREGKDNEKELGVGHGRVTLFCTRNPAQYHRPSRCYFRIAAHAPGDAATAGVSVDAVGVLVFSGSAAGQGAPASIQV